MTATRDTVIEKLWRGHDPLLDIPDNLFELDLQGWNSRHPYLAEAMAEVGEGVVVEVGVWKGGSAIFMAETLKAAGRDAALIAIDTWLGSSEHWLTPDYFKQMSFLSGYPALYHKFASNARRSGVGDYIVPLPLDSLNACHVLAGLQIRPAVIHLDGAHDFNSVSADLRAWWPLLAPGGLLVGDDYFTTGVWASVRDAFDTFFGAMGFPALENRGGKCRVRKPA
jgi:hypothetical protein